jgi:hypothetical protein
MVMNSEACTTHRGKVGYASDREAQVARRNIGHHGMRFGKLKLYKCPDCHRYFLATHTKRADRMRRYREQRLRA